MNGDGFGAPPWDPAEPVPEQTDGTQSLPGLGAAQGGQASGSPAQGSPAQGAPADASGWGKVTSAWLTGGSAERRGGIRRASFTPSGNGHSRAGTGQPAGQEPASDSGRSWRVPADTSVDMFNSKAVRDAESAGGAGRGKGEKKGKKPRKGGFWREFPILVVIALVLAMVIKSFVVQAFWIPSGSMQNTLAINDRILINKIVYHTRPIHRGDIVVFDGTGTWYPSSSESQNIFAKAFGEVEGLVGAGQSQNILVKRVIGLPGDHVVCCNSANQVTVNGVALSESSYLYPGEQRTEGPNVSKYSITVPAGDLWMLGDHPSVSEDSRGHLGDPGGGAIPESAVLGRAFVIIWPPSHWAFLNIPATFEQPQLNASNPAAAGGSPVTLASAMDNGTPIQQTGSPIPLALGFVGAVPLTWLQRRVRQRPRRRKRES
jgi:signal peptidase I